MARNADVVGFCLVQAGAAGFTFGRSWRWLSLVLAAGGMARTAILGQAVFYTAAGVDLWIPEGMLVKKVTGPARAFVVLIAAAAGAVAIIAFPPERLWRAEKSNGDTSSPDEP